MTDILSPAHAASLRDPADAAAPSGPAPSRWINRFARFTDDVPDVRRDGETPPAPATAQAPSSTATPTVPRRHVFGTDLPAQPFPPPHWIATSDDCAAMLGFPADWASRPDWQAIDVLSGRASWPGTRPMATVYSGHQFGVWAGQLGDGRALLLGEWQADPAPPRAPAADSTPARIAGQQGGAGPSAPSFELQLKGAGRTPYSRMGDGRAVLRSSVREFLCSEAMHALGVPTTRALCVAGSALPVMRETVETGAIVTRVAPSFLRFGHFEHFSHTGQHDALRRLVDFTIATQFPELQAGVHEGALDLDPLHSWLAEVVRRTARMVAHWQAVGFAHGVMNTDNMSVLGLTIDYGPFGFLDGFDPGHICNHSDTQGRYAFARQPNVAWWNLHALAHALRPLCADPDTSLTAVLDRYADDFTVAFSDHMRAKLGLELAEPEDKALLDDFLDLLASERADYTIAFRSVAEFDRGAGATPAALRDLFIAREAADAWGTRYLRRLEREPRSDAARRAALQRANPKYILRNHLAQRAIELAETGDFAEVRTLHAVLCKPYDEQPEFARLAGLPPDWARHIEVSCSS